MLDATSQAALVAQPAPRVPVARLVVGRSVDEVAALLPRLFNLCRSAQSAAVETALGRPVEETGIAQEILRDHLLKFHVTWPAFFGFTPCPLPTSLRFWKATLGAQAFSKRSTDASPQVRPWQRVWRW